MAERVVDEEGPRWLDERRQVVGRGQGYGRDAFLFEGPGNQSHGLMAERSSRNQQDEIGLHRLDTGEHFRDHLVEELGFSENAAHEGQVER